MKTLLLLALLGTLGFFLFIGRASATHGVAEPDRGVPANLPAGAIEVVEAQPFVVDQPFVHEWRKEKPLVSAGYLLVLKVAPDLARPRQTYEPVLYAGEQTAERCNFPENGAYLVVLVPAPADASGRVQLDLERTPIWFGSLELPERVDASRIAAEVASARAQGVRPARPGANARLRSTPAETLRVNAREDLNPYLADWIERYSPEETDLVAQLRQR
jgi:hypothetical protein